MVRSSCLRVMSCERALRLELAAIAGAGAERIGHLAEGGLDGKLVFRDRNIRLDVSKIEIRPVLTARKERQIDARRERPGAPEAPGRRSIEIGLVSEVASDYFTVLWGAGPLNARRRSLACDDRGRERRVVSSIWTIVVSAVATHLPFWNIVCSSLTELRPIEATRVPIATSPGQVTSDRKSRTSRAITNAPPGSASEPPGPWRISTRPVSRKVANTALFTCPCRSVSP